MEIKALRAAIYARVSSDQQAEAGTIRSQVAALRDRVGQDGVALGEEDCFIDDGFSGATLVRPGLEQLRDVAAAGSLDRVYVHSPDRLARKYAYQVLLVDELDRCGVEVVFLNHEVGKSPEGDLLLQMQGMIAEYERAKILERSRRGKRHAAHNGSVAVLSGAPYGYRYVSRDAGGGQAEYVINLEEAPIVQDIFTWVGQERVSIGEVCRRLESQGRRTRGNKAWWDRTTVWGILKNPAYKGMAAFGKTRRGSRRPRVRTQRGKPEHARRTGSTYDVPQDQWISIPVPAIVEEEVFDAVQEQLAENRRRNRKSDRGAKYLLQGLLVCKRCGYAYYGKPISRSSRKGRTRTYAYYRCVGTDAYRFGGHRVCDNTQVRTDLLEEAVWEDVCKLLAEPNRLEEEYGCRLKRGRPKRGERTLIQTKTLIRKLRSGISRLIDAYTEEVIDKEEFRPRLEGMKRRLAAAEAESQALDARMAEQRDLRLVVGRIEEFAKQVRANLSETDWMKRREILRTLVKQVEVDRDDVRIVYRVNPPPLGSGPRRGGLQDCLRHAFPFAVKCRAGRVRRGA